MLKILKICPKLCFTDLFKKYFEILDFLMSTRMSHIDLYSFKFALLVTLGQQLILLKIFENYQKHMISGA